MKPHRRFAVIVVVEQAIRRQEAEDSADPVADGLEQRMHGPYFVVDSGIVVGLAVTRRSTGLDAGVPVDLFDEVRIKGVCIGPGEETFMDLYSGVFMRVNGGATNRWVRRTYSSGASSLI